MNLLMDKVAETREMRVEPRVREFNIIGATDRDSFGTAKWKEYLTPQALEDAWKPPTGSPYKRFLKIKTIEAVGQLVSEIKPRYSEYEQISERGIENLIATANLGRDTAVILDSGGAHSVAMAATLAEKGFQLIVMLDAVPHPEGVTRSEQHLAALLYFASKVERLKAEGVIQRDSPPVFVLDTHRSDHRILFPDQVDNTYDYIKEDFPTAEELKQHGITKVVYVNEGDQEGRINPPYQDSGRLRSDLKAIARNWEEGDIQMLYTGVSPTSDYLGGIKSKNNSEFDSRRFEQSDDRLLYYDMKPSVYGVNSGIAMHRNRTRFIVTNEGQFEVINEDGIARAMTNEEISQFKREVEHEASTQLDSQKLKDLYDTFAFQRTKK